MGVGTAGRQCHSATTARCTTSGASGSPPTGISATASRPNQAIVPCSASPLSSTKVTSSWRALAVGDEAGEPLAEAVAARGQGRDRDLEVLGQLGEHGVVLAHAAVLDFEQMHFLGGEAGHVGDFPGGDAALGGAHELQVVAEAHPAPSSPAASAAGAASAESCDAAAISRSGFWGAAALAREARGLAGGSVAAGAEATSAVACGGGALSALAGAGAALSARAWAAPGVAKAGSAEPGKGARSCASRRRARRGGRRRWPCAGNRRWPACAARPARPRRPSRLRA